MSLAVHLDGASERELREIERALVAPHHPRERFDPEFPVAFRCSRCGKMGYGPRRLLREAVTAHWQEDCPARRSRADAPKEMRLFYPRVKE